jgi:hypothetical protein
VVRIYRSLPGGENGNKKGQKNLNSHFSILAESWKEGKPKFAESLQLFPLELMLQSGNTS